jgi:anthranilate phosphoribosyltransferase
VLEQLGLSLPLDEAAAGECLAGSGFTFLFAPHYHPAMKSIAPVRQALGVRTVFNILGPLSNPAAPAFHVLGAFSEAVAELMAGTLAGMPGVRRAFVVHGAAGWDEPTPIGPFTLYDVRDGRVTPGARAPADYGLPACTAEALAGGDAAANARELRAVLEGGRHGAHRDALLMGASLALECAGEVDGPEAGVARAARAIEDGSAARVLAALRRVGARIAAGRAP